MNIVLLEPEIPANTGNIGRTCVASNTALHLIRPLGFSTDDKALKRAGLDYWHELDVTYYDSFGEFTEKNEGAELYFATTKAERTYADVSYGENAFIVFGKESAGIPEEILVKHRERCIRIPMFEDKRSLNLSNSAAIILYEALRQNGFKGLEKAGALHRLRWK
ncbi:MAG: tRNA (cytidine(34)-2'-O)-methyltransferase [Clostridiales bacterium]|nr:tRNA (cytidine(34)-2'-O)-methyltransferase [Clostridiales bacterium]